MVSRIIEDAERDAVLHEAAQWSLELSSGDIPAERIAQWQQWLAASETHRAAFDRILSTWSAVDRCATGTAAWPSDAEVDCDAYDGSVSVSAWRSRVATKRASRRRPWLTIGLAAAAAVTALAILPVIRSMQFAQPVVTVVETASGEHRDVPLSDGSIISAGAQSMLWATLARDSREVTLERGEAFFRVAKDPERPFIVKVGTTTVAAVGTAFNVRRAGDRVVVGVSEGIVKVDERSAGAHQQRTVIRTARLRVGQQLSIDASDGSASVQTVDAIGIAAWRKGRLQYRNEPLRSVIADLARYSAREIVIANPQVADLRITGTVFAGDVDSWLQSLETALPVRVVRAPDGSARLESR
ncbi:MAG TPA: FecR domain-containing protein [Steroidobacteraceae bacterium]|nr:FecR domain-containing protein [Steroidobacteraceae bacterium]